MSEFILQLEPAEKIVFSGKLGEEAVPTALKITNTTKDRQVCKVKCTSNEMFRIRPPVFALKAGEEGTVKLTFNAGKTVPENGKHYFVVYYIKSDDESKAPRACWADHKEGPDGTKRLYVDFKDEGEGGEGGEKKEGEGEGEKKEGEGEKKEGEGEKKEGEGEKKEGEGEKKEGEGEKKEGDGEKKEGEEEKKEGEGEKKEEEKKEEEKVKFTKEDGQKADEKKEGEGEKKD
ncbi:unnamed protein product [Anisakis simplex]|uniref:Major sperm protein n=1 Tax=Anisakis simplex TaxID=6269 RepID=A0A0M3J0A7_ANISI|nr:unnamed protein product [Anisakis simplex]